MSNLPTNFGVSRTFRCRSMGQHLSDASRDLATFTFDLGGHGTCRWCGSSCSVCVPSLNFVGLPVRKILGIYCVSINPPGDIELWPLNPKTVSLLVYPKVIPYTKFEHFGIIRFRVMLRTNRQTNKQTDSKIKSYPRRPTESAWVISSLAVMPAKSGMCDNSMYYYSLQQSANFISNHFLLIIVVQFWQLFYY